MSNTVTRTSPDKGKHFKDLVRGNIYLLYEGDTSFFMKIEEVNGFNAIGLQSGLPYIQEGETVVYPVKSVNIESNEK